MQVGRSWRRGAGDATLRMPCCLQIQFARSRGIKKPGVQDAILDDRKRASGHAFAVERPRAQSALAQRIVDNANARLEQPLSKLVLEEARLARDRAAVDRTR